MADERAPGDNTDKEKASAGVPDAKRRRAIKAGLIAAPVILTLKSQPAWARQDTSGSLSGGSQVTNLQQKPEIKQG